jgi:glycosyltransferase involved in cell wall biosynthesis
MQSLKILLVTGIFPPDYGGPASYISDIASAFAQRHTILGVITLSDAQTHNDAIYSFPVVRILRKQNKFRRFIQTINSIYKFSRKADVVYLNGLVLEGVIACKIFSSKAVVSKVVGDLVWEKARNRNVTQDDIDVFQKNRYSFFWEFLKRLQVWYTRKADFIITPCRFLSEIVAGWNVSNDRIEVIYNAFNVKENMKQPHIMTEPSYDMLTVTRLVPWKGVSELIDIAIQNNWKLKIVGDGPLRGDLERYVASHKAKQLIFFTGYIPREKVIYEIKTAKVFLLNSSYEGLPHTILEAKAAGVPVIAAAAGGIPEVINDGVDGFMVPVGDSRAMTEKIRFLLEHPDECLHIGVAGQRHVETYFSFNTMVLKTEHVLKSISHKTKAGWISS